MWTRAELKEKARNLLSKDYWKFVLVGLILSFVSGGSSGGGGGSSAGSGFSQGLSSGLNSSGSGASAGHSAQIPNEVWQGLAVLVVSMIAVIAIIFIVSILIKIFALNPFLVGVRRFNVRSQVGPQNMNVIVAAFQNGNYGNTVKTMFLKDLYTSLWSLLFVIPGIVKSYEYRMVPYLLGQDPSMDCKEAFALSKQMMDGEKWNAFVLDLSWIGWYLLCGLTCGLLALFYVTPYVMLTDGYLFTTLKNKIAPPQVDKTENLA